jgi:hypothetical protein
MSMCGEAMMSSPSCRPACIMPNDDAGKKQYVFWSIAIFFKKEKKKKENFSF